MTGQAAEAGLFARVPAGLWGRLVDHARRQLAAELRYTPDGEPVDNTEILERFLASRPGGPARSLPTPSAEPGDLLVKAGRGECWTFTVQGWRELAPVHVVAFATDPPTYSEFVASLRDHGLEHSGLAAALRADEQKRRRGPISDHGLHGGIAAGRAPGGAGSISESATLPKPWEPDDRQKQILDAIGAQETACVDAIKALKRVHMGGKDGHIKELEHRKRGLGEARHIVYAAMRRLYGPQGVA